MGDESSRRSDKSLLDMLKEEWSLFFESFIEDDTEENTVSKYSQETIELLERMTTDELENLKRNLSAEKKSINQQLEILQKEMDQLNDQFEQAKFQSEDTSKIQTEMNLLSDKGHRLIHKLKRLDERSKFVYRHEQQKLEDL